MKKNGFTLIELSILIIVIGLIIGSILVGQEIIAQGRLRVLINDINNLQSSINIFKTKYGYLPGDFPDASSTFNDPNCPSGSAPTGCDGNADGTIDGPYPTSGTEIYRFWQHLSLAELVKYTYKGTNNLKDSFKSVYPDIYISARNTRPFQNSKFYNVLEIGSWGPSVRLAAQGGLTQSDVYNIDNKMDDGIANSGNIFGFDGGDVSTRTCSYNWASDLNGRIKYILNANQGPYCRLNKVID